MKTKLIFIIIAISAITALNCDSWITGTFTITYDIDDIISSDSNIGGYLLDLNDEEDYEEHRDDIKSIDQVNIIGWIKNRSSVPVAGEIWVDLNDSLFTPDAVRDSATLVFATPIPIPGPADSIFIDWPDGLQYMQNMDTLKNYIQNIGYFAMYGLADEAPFDIEMDLEVVITITVGR